MEWVGILAGFAWAGIVGYLVGQKTAPGGRRKAAGDDEESLTASEVKALRTEWKDTLDRLALLYDRIRKRAQVPTESTESAAPRVLKEGPEPQFKTGAEVYAAARGMGLTLK